MGSDSRERYLSAERQWSKLFSDEYNIMPDYWPCMGVLPIKKHFRTWSVVVLALLAIIGLYLFFTDDPAADMRIGSISRDEKEREKPLPQEPAELLIVATGDIMVHKTQFPSALNPATGDFEFAKWFAPVEKYLREGDVTIGNLETTLAGEELAYTGYPAFNTPESLAADLKKAGFSVMSTANNHCMDRLEAGVQRTAMHLEKAGLAFTGTARSAGERDNFPIMEKNGIRAAFLAYTYGTNGIPIPGGKKYLVNMIDEDLIRKDIGSARKKGAEIVVVSMHWGQEYSREPNEEQQQLAGKIISWGGDLILGSHPHVLQRVEFISTGDEESRREGVVVYSLGNFIADQIMKHTDSGMILRIHYRRDEEGRISVAKINCVPTWIHIYSQGGPRQFRVVSVDDALADYRRGSDPLLRDYHAQRLEEVREETLGLIRLNPYRASR